MRSSRVCTFFGVNSASELMNVSWPSRFWRCGFHGGLRVLLPEGLVPDLDHGEEGQKAHGQRGHHDPVLLALEPGPHQAELGKEPGERRNACQGKGRDEGETC